MAQESCTTMQLVRGLKFFFSSIYLHIIKGRFPPLSHAPGYRSSLMVHIEKMTKSMPIEEVNIVPFLDVSSQQVEVNRRRQSAPLTRSHPVNGSSPQDSKKGQWRTFDVCADEKDENQSQLATAKSKKDDTMGGVYKTRRKYFVFAFSEPEQ